MRSRSPLFGVVLLALAVVAAAAPQDEAIIALDRYTTEKGSVLATAFSGQLRNLYGWVYHCRPWLEVKKRGLGFTRAVGVPGDDRYLNLWVWVDQEITPEFARLSQVQRHSAMFSRHGVDLLRKLSDDSRIFTHPGVHGYSVILTWIKPDGGVGDQTVEETLGVFADKATVRAYLDKRIAARAFVETATIVAFDGDARLGRVPLEIWDDDFAKTFQLKGYTPDPSQRC